MLSWSKDLGIEIEKSAAPTLGRRAPSAEFSLELINLR